VVRIPGRKSAGIAPDLSGAGPDGQFSRLTPCIRSDELFRGSREVVIRHNMRDYRLRLTAQGKLILTA